MGACGERTSEKLKQRKQPLTHFLGLGLGQRFAALFPIYLLKFLNRLFAELHRQGICLRRDNWVSVRYAEELNSTTSSVTLQRADRHATTPGPCTTVYAKECVSFSRKPRPRSPRSEGFPWRTLHIQSMPSEIWEFKGRDKNSEAPICARETEASQEHL